MFALFIVGLLFCAPPAAAQTVATKSYMDTVTTKAALGDPAAQFNLGVMFHNGQGVPRDDKKAAEWIRRAADQGYAHAEMNMALLYQAGRGVAQDHAEAAIWARKAAVQGFPPAQLFLSTLYRKGEGVPKDDKLAQAWFMRAAMNTDPANPLTGDLPKSSAAASWLAWLGMAVIGVSVFYIINFFRRRKS